MSAAGTADRESPGDGGRDARGRGAPVRGLDRRLGDVDDGDGESGEDEDEDEAEEAGAEDYYY